jgi:nucleoid-associated protein YgaU
MFAKLLVVIVLAALAVGLVARTSQGAGPEQRYVVKPSDTLWSIAARTYGGDVREGVWKLEQRNHLGSATISPGQTLILPAG